MGAAASIETNALLDKEQTKALVGNSFSEDLWSVHANSSGYLQSETLLDLVAQSNALEAPIYLIEFETFCRHGRLPRCPDDSALLTDSRVLDRSSALVVFVSHAWLHVLSSAAHDEHPRPDTARHEKFQLCVAGVRQLLDMCSSTSSSSTSSPQCYLWIDFSCLDQDANPSAALKFQSLTRIFSLCHCMFTPLLHYTSPEQQQQRQQQQDGASSSTDNDWYTESWQAEGEGAAGYLSRGWCRLEMLYANTVPLPGAHTAPSSAQPSSGGERDLDQDQDKDSGRYRGSLRTAVVGARRRPHYLLRPRQAAPLCLPPAPAHLYLPQPQQQGLQLDPLAGDTSLPRDHFRIKALLLELRLMYDTAPPRVGYRGATSTSTSGRGSGSGDQKPHGQGVQLYSSGNCYSGQWRAGRKHGRGRMVFAQGDVYEGGYVEGRKQGPEGCFQWRGGDCYRGAWERDQLHGQGCFCYANGNEYRGSYVRGREHGAGKLILWQDSVFEGQFKDGLFVSGVNYAYEHLSRVQEARSQMQEEEDEQQEQQVEVEVFQFSDFISTPGEDKALWESKTTGTDIDTETQQPVGLGNMATAIATAASQCGAQQKKEGKDEGKDEGKEDEEEEGAVVLIPGKYFFPDGSVYVGELDVLTWTMHGRGTWSSAADGSEHRGMFAKGLRHGRGVHMTAEGGEERGRWSRGVLRGAASHAFPNGDLFEGRYEDGAKSGQGQLTTAGGEVLLGCWERGVMRAAVEVLAPSEVVAGVEYGTVRCQEAGGARYEGEVKAGRMHGQGRYTYPNGDVYEGGFLEGEKSGTGWLRFTSHRPPSASSGEEQIDYRGQFEHDQMHGEGVMTFSSSAVVYSGAFRRGRWEGRGELRFPSGDRFRGGFRGGLKHGPAGVFQWADGARYEGGYSENKWHGAGRYTYANGDEYSGTYANGHKHGPSGNKFVWAASCAIYLGGYKEGLKHGYGKHVYATGDVYEGMYENNRKHGMGKLTTLHGQQQLEGAGTGGSCYEGPFERGRKHGTGVLTLAGGSGEQLQWQVTFAEGELVSQQPLLAASITASATATGVTLQQGGEGGGGVLLGGENDEDANIDDEDDDDGNRVGRQHYSSPYRRPRPDSSHSHHQHSHSHSHSIISHSHSDSTNSHSLSTDNNNSHGIISHSHSQSHNTRDNTRDNSNTQQQQQQGEGGRGSSSSGSSRPSPPRLHTAWEE